MLINNFLKHRYKLLIYILLNGLSICVLIHIYSIYGLLFSYNSNQYNFLTIGIDFLISVAFLFVLVNIIAYLQLDISYLISKENKEKLFEIGMGKNSNLNFASYIMNDMDALENNLYYETLDIIGTSMQSFLFLYMIASINIKYALLAIGILIPIIIFQVLNTKKIIKTNEMIMENQQEEVKSLNKILERMIDIKTNEQDTLFINKMKKVLLNTNMSKYIRNRQLVFLSAMLMLLIYFLKSIMTFTLINDGFKYLIDVASVAIIIGYINNVANPVRTVIQSLVSISSVNGIYRRVKSALHVQNFHLSEIERKQLNCNEIKLKNLKIVYSDKTILNNVKYTFCKNTHYAIMGENGAGKSTLLKAILGLLDYEGNIYVDDKKIHHLTIGNCVGYLPQNCKLLKATLKDNITMYDTSVHNEDIIDALKKVKLEYLLQNDGLNREVSQSSKTLSSGEIKRICLARLLCRNCKVLLIDEGTSALDKENTEEFEKILYELKDKIIISVIHKSEYKKYYQVVLKINNGMMEEIDHAE